MQPSVVGIQIREVRQKKGWSLAYLAEQSGRSAQAISAIELGASQSPQLKTVLPILGALGINPSKALSPQEVAT